MPRLLRLSLFFLLCLSAPNLAAQEGCIEGRVLDPDGSPVPFVYILAITPDHSTSHAVNADTDGTFNLDVPSGEYDVVASAEFVAGAPSVGRENENSAVRVRVVEGTQCSSVSLRQSRRAHLHLRVTDIVTLQPITSPDASFRANANDRWMGELTEQQELLLPGHLNLQVQVYALGYQNSDVLQIPALQPGEVRELDIALRSVAMGCINGTITDAEGVALPGARLQLSATAQGAGSYGISFSDESGKFRFGEVQPGLYAVFANVEGYPLPGGDTGTSRADVIPGSSCANVAMKLGPRAARLSVKVIDALSRKTIKDANTWAHAGDEHAAWSLRIANDPMPVPALTSFQLTASAPGYVSSQDRVIAPLQPDETLRLIIALQPKPANRATTNVRKPPSP